MKLVRDDFVLPQSHSVTVGIPFSPVWPQISVDISLLSCVHEAPIKGGQDDITFKQSLSNRCNVK